jgi:hypothetical protein
MIRGAGESLIPLEAIEDALHQLNALLLEAESAKIPVLEARNSFESALRSWKGEKPQLAILSAVNGLNKVAGALQPYTWIEAEASQNHTFSEALQHEAAAGGGFLLLNSETAPTGGGYFAQLEFSVPRDDAYMVWLSATPPGPEASRFYWTIDSDEPQTSAQAVPVGGAYLQDRLTWLRLGRARLKKGDHTLTLRVTDRAASGRFQLSLDSFLVTRYPFTPSGTARPPLVLLSANRGELPDPSKLRRRP